MTKEKTINDFIAKDNKDLSFQERAKKFEEMLEPICKELGVVPWAKMSFSDEGIVAIPQIKDLWEGK